MNEQKLPLLIIKDDYVLAGLYRGFVQVEAGTCTILGTLQGVLMVYSGVTVYMNGLHQGNLYIFTGGKVIVAGTIQGTIKMEPGALLIIEETANFDGLLSNNGEVIVRGVISGGQLGNVSVRFEGHGKIQSSIIRDRVKNTRNDKE